MRFLKFIFPLSIIFFSLIPSLYSHSFIIQKQVVSDTTMAKGGGSIVMTDMIMAMTLNDIDDNILKFQILNSDGDLILEAYSCYNYHCKYNLLSLPSGIYTVIVFTEKNDVLSSEINL